MSHSSEKTSLSRTEQPLPILVVAAHHGQVYVPTVNRLLMVATVSLVVGFHSSSALAGAFGLAVAITMSLDTLLVSTLARRSWRWPANWTRFRL